MATNNKVHHSKKGMISSTALTSILTLIIPPIPLFIVGMIDIDSIAATPLMHWFGAVFTIVFAMIGSWVLIWMIRRNILSPLFNSMQTKLSLRLRFGTWATIVLLPNNNNNNNNNNENNNINDDDDIEVGIAMAKYISTIHRMNILFIGLPSYLSKLRTESSSWNNNNNKVEWMELNQKNNNNNNSNELFRASLDAKLGGMSVRGGVGLVLFINPTSSTSTTKPSTSTKLMKNDNVQKEEEDNNNNNKNKQHATQSRFILSFLRSVLLHMKFRGTGAILHIRPTTTTTTTKKEKKYISSSSSPNSAFLQSLISSLALEYKERGIHIQDMELVTTTEKTTTTMMERRNQLDVLIHEKMSLL